MKSKSLILLSFLLLLAILVLFVTLFYYRKFIEFVAGKVKRERAKHGDIVQKLVEGDRSSSDGVSDRLKSLGDMDLIEAILDRSALEKNVPVSYFKGYYDVTGITNNYIEILKSSESWKKRALAAEKLGLIGSAEAVPHLIDVVRDVKDEDEDVRGASLRALGRIKDKRALPFLINALGYPEKWLPPRIGETIYSIGEDAIEPLIRELENFENENRRAWSAEILGWLKAENAAVFLIDALSDVSAEMRAKAVGALGKIRESRAVPKLLEMLISDPVPFVRARVAQGLGAIAHPSVTDYLINILKDPEWWVRVRAVEALEQIGEPAVPGLLVALQEGDGEVRRMAGMALERMGYVARVLVEYGGKEFKPGLRKILLLVITAGITEGMSEKLFHAEPTLQKRVVRLFGEAGSKKSAAALLELLNASPDWTLRARIIESLGNMGATEAIPEIIKYLKAGDYWVRTASVEALGKLEAHEFAPEIAEILIDKSPIARESALRALSRLKVDSYADRMMPLLDDPSPAVRAAAISMVRCLGIPVDTGRIVQCMKDPSDEVRIEAVRYYSFRNDRDVFRDAVGLISGGAPDVRDAVAEYLTTVKPVPFPEIISLLNPIRLSPGEVSTLIRIASGMGGKEAHRFVLGETESGDTSVREQAVFALSVFKEKGDSAIFVRGLFDPHEGVRIASLIGVLEAPSVPAVMKIATPLSKDAVLDVRVAFALAAGAAGLSELAPVLVFLSEDQSPRVVAAALMGLASFDDPSTLSVIYERENVTQIREEIDRINDDARFQPLLLRLRKNARETKNLEVELLLTPDIGGFVNKIVGRVKGSPDEKSRIRTMAVLKLVASAENFPTLLGLMKTDPSPEVRIKAMEAIVHVGREDEVVSALSSMLADPAMKVKIKAAEFFGDYDGAKILGEALLHSIDTHDRELREAVTSSLSKILKKDPERVTELTRIIPESKTKKLGLIWLMGKTRKRGCLKYLVNMLGDGDGDVRAAAVGALSKFKRRMLIRYMERMLGDPDERVRAAAVNAISRTGDKSAFPIILNMLSDGDGFVRRRAAMGIAKLDVTQARKTFEASLSRSPELRPFYTGILYGLGICYEEPSKMDSEAKKVVFELCPEEEMIKLARYGKDNRLRLHGIRVLALNQSEQFREIVSNALKDSSPEIREEAEKYRWE